MHLYYLLLCASFIFLTGSALAALWWAVRHQQFQDNAKAALLIFEDEEPVGKITDGFPGQHPAGPADPARPNSP